MIYNYETLKYDTLLEEILCYGDVRVNKRTGIKTISIFGDMRHYDVSKSVPLLTGRRLYWKSIVKELLWFLSGSTNVGDLEEMGVNYWSPWRDEDFEKEHGFISGALGPTYGHQLRAFGHPYGNGYFSGPGLNDQLLTLIDNIKKDPTDRGHIINLWNPAQIPLMKLRPCLYGYQFGVDSQGNMDLMINQRSADVPVGVPANLFFSTCFLYMVAQQTGYKPRNLIHSIADAHIYDNQIDAVKEYLGRTSPPDPNLTINKAADILSYKIEDFELENYNPLPPIKFEVAI